MKLVGTRDPRDVATFLEATAGATPAHGGLFTFDAWPRFDDVDELLALPWRERCIAILGRLVGDELDRDQRTRIVDESLDFPVPVVALADGTYALELFHGPTLAFKDFGARFLAAVLARIAPRAGAPTRTILTATSGDTGAAVAHAFWRRAGVRVVVLYPRGRVSPLQERQIASLGENVTTFAVDGSFDDCQALVKQCFADAALVAELGLTSANSINIARLIAQVLYEFEAVADLRRRGVRQPLVVSVPSGNFGNLCAGLMAERFGLPVRAFVAATNANATVPEYLAGGAYRPRASVATMSNAMDVGDPSNWERIEAMFGRDRASMLERIRSGSVDDDATRDEIRRLAAIGYVACPHTAVAHRMLRSALRPGEVGVFLATAHAAKFREVLEPVLGRIVDVPDRLAAVASRPVLSTSISVDREKLVACMRVTRA